MKRGFWESSATSIVWTRYVVYREKSGCICKNHSVIDKYPYYYNHYDDESRINLI